LIIQEKRAAGIPVLELSGSMTMGLECERLAEEVERLVQQNQTRIIIDLSALQHIDSAGVGRIVSCLGKLRRVGGDLRMAGAQGMVASVLKMTRVEHVAGMYPTAAAAAENFPPADPSGN
jgi:anti-sigma B factor antagonist